MFARCRSSPTDLEQLSRQLRAAEVGANLRWTCYRFITDICFIVGQGLKKLN